MNNVRVRFAPSPTGFLHIGSLRTVLFNYVIAKRYDGNFILRIEDTDQKREVEGATEELIKTIDWLGIKFDEGPGFIRAATNGAHANLENLGEYGPYVQSARQKIYDKYIKELLDKGEAYKCFCDEKRLAKMREEQQKKKLASRYDRACRDLDDDHVRQMEVEGKPYVIRQKMPIEGEVVVRDELRGEIKFEASDLDDHILVKSNGVPTYQFANVVDDHLMEISHVLRGEEWIPSLPKNILLYKSFGWEAPKYIHVPLILNKAGGKLSKRDGDVTVEAYKGNGYLPEALINYSMLLGWSPYAKASSYTKVTDDKSESKHPKNKNEEILDLDEVIKKFEIKDIGISGAVFDSEKLDYFNGYYIRQKNLDELVKLCLPYLEREFEIKNHRSSDYIKKAIALAQDRMKKLSDIIELSKFFFVDELEYEKKLLIWKKLSHSEIKENLEKLLSELGNIDEKDWEEEKLQEKIIAFIKSIEGKNGDYLWPMRVALTGEKASPSPFEVAGVLGKEKSVKRIKEAVSKL